MQNTFLLDFGGMWPCTPAVALGQRSASCLAAEQAGRRGVACCSRCLRSFLLADTPDIRPSFPRPCAGRNGLASETRRSVFYIGI